MTEEGDKREEFELMLLSGTSSHSTTVHHGQSTINQ